MGEVVETMGRATRARWPLALALGAVLVLGAGPAVAQGGFSIARFHPTASPRTGFITVEPAQNLPSGGWELAHVLDYADDPLVAEQDGELVFAVVYAQLLALLMGAWAPVSAFQFSVDVGIFLLHTAGEVCFLG
jgi:hypothetical protein